jgi:acetylornithine deacetylase/succinyl-diaminopimelate desuccinylase-like protein
MELVDNYINKLDIQGLHKKIFQPEGMSPLIVYLVDKQEGANDTQLMFYGHLDKQPWMEPWGEGLGPTKPVIRGDYLFGRGGGDDGYAPFSTMLAIKNAQIQGIPHPRCALVLETEEESGSPNLIALLNIAKEYIGNPDYLFCLDSGAFDYNQLWLTSSLRGITLCDVTVKAAKGGYHSGEVGGIVPETFRVMRHLLDRIDNSETGDVIKELETELPEYALPEAKRMAELMKSDLAAKYKMEDGVKFCSDDMETMYLNNTWKANLSVTGAGGLPPYEKAGNVVRPSTSFRLSCRLPPNMDAHKAAKIVREKLTTNVPHNCVVEIKGDHNGNGWCMKDPEPWFHESLNNAARSFFDGKEYGSYGMGGSIPFLAQLGGLYPNTFIIALGLLGPQSNAHAPDESVNLAYAKKLTAALSHVLVDVGL